ncbi:DUF4937 domain-containing protein [Bacillus sp. ISL-51]|uniref:DUF4937 domain-containing protein n=1 Tax=Bacteria TaxID=2 RepID=UPI001BE60BC6|nr:MULTISPECIES: DUF4937 domain-containing protein [Bacteria]MBT2573171.1 DUF4937 domain-containing protein [Bacillus sp. ISL-51]MBT2635074.1 DUF4937 domain-containing protein [Bacillus sp. ISL-26]MBT2712005.1 DUF4937 domain-containing protein [Pseudomonas sp. ISL-88]
MPCSRIQAEEFSKAQSKWSELSKVKGFMRQAGGWRTDEDGHLIAVIVGVWENRRSYEEFMAHSHDQIFANSKQNDTFQSINVQLYETDDVRDFFRQLDLRFEPEWMVLNT